MININIADCKNCSGTQSLFLTFPYDEKVVNVVRSLPSRFWDKEKKEWEVPFDKLSQILTQLSDYEFEITGTYKMPAVVTENDIDFHFNHS